MQLLLCYSHLPYVLFKADKIQMLYEQQITKTSIKIEDYKNYNDNWLFAVRSKLLASTTQ